MLVKLLTNLGGRQYPFTSAEPDKYQEGMEVELDDDIGKFAIMRRHAVEIIVPPKVTAKVATAPVAVATPTVATPMKAAEPIVPETKVTAKTERNPKGKD